MWEICVTGNRFRWSIKEVLGHQINPENIVNCSKLKSDLINLRPYDFNCPIEAARIDSSFDCNFKSSVCPLVGSAWTLPSVFGKSLWWVHYNKSVTRIDAGLHLKQWRVFLASMFRMMWFFSNEANLMKPIKNILSCGWVCKSVASLD